LPDDHNQLIVLVIVLVDFELVYVELKYNYYLLDDARHPVTPEGDAPGPARADKPVRLTLKGIASIVAPASLVTALLFYFGWARTNSQAQVLGLDYSLFDFSTQEYLLRSIDPMYWPLFVGAVAALAGLAFHAGLVSLLRPSVGADGRQRIDERWRPRLVALYAVLGVMGLTALILGLVGANVDHPSRIVSLWSPVLVTVAVVLLGYGFALVVRFGFLRVPGASVATRADPTPTTHPSSEIASLRLWGEVVLVVLLLLSLFWSVARYAQIKGIDQAVAVERAFPGLPDAVIYSDKRLHLPDGVTETQLDAPDQSAYHYRYSGLKLLFRSGNRFFLRPTDPSISNVNIIVADSPSLRFEFSR
jgi:hypothetical protein